MGSLSLFDKIQASLFQSVTTRTAGFFTVPQKQLTSGSTVVSLVLMFVGGSPVATAGGIKTTTFFALLQGIKSAATGKQGKAFRCAMPKDAFRKASVITLLALGIIMAGTFCMTILEPQLSLQDIVFEMVSAYGTVGLSTGITHELGIGSKVLSILIMYTGRVGPITVVSLWYYQESKSGKLPEGDITIG